MELKNGEEDDIVLIRKSGRNPTKRHCCREDSSWDWFNWKNSMSLKASRCSESDRYTRNADLLWKSLPMKLVRHVKRQENAITNGIHYENQDWVIELSSSSEPTSSTSTESDSSAIDLEDQESDKASQTSGVTEGTELTMKEELKTVYSSTFKNKIIPENRSHEMNDNHWEEMSSYTTPWYIGQHGEDETGLIDVPLTVNASRRAEKVPFVCLTSKLDGKAVTGYPVEIEVISEFSETLLHRNENVAPNLLDDDGGRLRKLVWRTSKRTPVCYVTNSVSLVSGNSQSGRVRINGLIMKEQSLEKCMKNGRQVKRGRAGPSESCIPVERIFGKILAAVSPGTILS